jgi:hypothetical protein
MGDDEGRNTGSEVARSNDFRSRADRSAMSIPLCSANYGIQSRRRFSFSTGERKGTQDM